MSAYEWIEHKGKKIFYMNLSVKTADDLKERIKLMKPVIIKEPPKSILCIADVKDGNFSPEITQIIKDFAKHNEPYIKATACVGVEGLKQVIFTGVLAFTKRKNLVLKNTRLEALDWLVEQ
jgi:hypothetical protein